MFQALLNKRAANRAYKRAVDDCLTVLFCGFPDGLLPLVKHQVNKKCKWELRYCPVAAIVYPRPSVALIT